MGFVFELPEVGEGVVEAEVVDWLVSPGDSVSIDQPLCEITTDKAQLEISSPRAGTIVKLFGEPGDIIKVHTPLVEIDESGAPAAPAPSKAAEKTAPAPAPTKAAPAPAPRAPAASNAGETKATPAVRRHAREEGIDIHQVAGTGPRGRVTHEDLDQYKVAGAAPIAPPALPQVTPSGHEERVPIRGIRRAIAQQMVKSKHTAPHFTYVEEVDCTKLVALRKQLKPMAEARGVKLTYLPFFMKCCSIAFRDFPNVNAVMDEEAFELVVKGDHNIGIATDTPNGLYVPVVKNVEQKSILALAAELQDLTARTRAGKVSLDELRGGTFTITGVGSIGGVMATPILNVPEVGILGTNAIRDRVVPMNGELVVRKMMYLSNSFDHRIIDGAVGARFTARLKEIIETPEALLLDLS